MKKYLRNTVTIVPARDGFSVIWPYTPRYDGYEAHDVIAWQCETTEYNEDGRSTFETAICPITVFDAVPSQSGYAIKSPDGECHRVAAGGKRSTFDSVGTYLSVLAKKKGKL